MLSSPWNTSEYMTGAARFDSNNLDPMKNEIVSVGAGIGVTGVGRVRLFKEKKGEKRT